MLSRLFENLAYNGKRFFIWYYMIIILLILWSYIEGVGDIQGTITILSGPKAGRQSLFKAGYFSTLNYGIYYVFVMPFFLNAVLNTYRTAFDISKLKINDSEIDSAVILAVNNYSSKVIRFLKFKITGWIFLLLLLLFSYQNMIQEQKNKNGLSLGWVQGYDLKNKLDGNSFDINTKGFYLKNEKKGGALLYKVDSIKISDVAFLSDRKPGKIEFVIFVVVAKFFFSLFETLVFFFNINVLYCLVAFFWEKDRESLLKSSEFIRKMEMLITNISLSGLFLTIFVYFRYIANMQKGSFQPFKWENGWANDQYTFLFGMLFIPISSIILFLYLYSSEKAVDIKALSIKKLISLYLPTIGFVVIFLIYLLEFDPYMHVQLKFLNGVLSTVNDYLI